MNRLQIYIITIVITVFLTLVGVFGHFAFTVAELTFFIASILMVFSFEKTPTEDLDKPQIHQYVTNRLNFYNYLAAGNVALFVSLYVLLKYIDPYRALLYLFVVWGLCTVGFKYIYNYTAFRKFKYTVSDYLILVTSKNKEFFHVTETKIAKFVDKIFEKEQLIDSKALSAIASEVEIEGNEAAAMFELAREYTILTQDPLKSSELP